MSIVTDHLNTTEEIRVEVFGENLFRWMGEMDALPIELPSSHHRIEALAS